MLAFTFTFCIGLSGGSNVIKLRVFRRPKSCVRCSRFRIFRIIRSKYTLTRTSSSFNTVMFVVPGGGRRFCSRRGVILGGSRYTRHIKACGCDAGVRVRGAIPTVEVISNIRLPGSGGSTSGGGGTKGALFSGPNSYMDQGGFRMRRILRSKSTVTLRVERAVSKRMLASSLRILVLTRRNDGFCGGRVIGTPRNGYTERVNGCGCRRCNGAGMVPVVTFGWAVAILYRSRRSCFLFT